MYYAAITVLKWSEEEFWRSTPRKLMTMICLQKLANSPNKKKEKPTGFIDEVF